MIEENKTRSNLVKIIILLLIALVIGLFAFNIKAIKEGRILTHEEIIFNDYFTKNERFEIYIIDENTITYSDTTTDKVESYQYTYSEGLISIVLPEETLKIIFLGTNRIYFQQKNKILYLHD